MMIRKALWFALIAPCFFGIGYVIHRVLMVPENHVGLNPWLLAAGVIPACASFFVLNGRWRLASMLIGALTVLIVWGAIELNLLLQYEDWIDRGMPSKPEWLRAVRLHDRNGG